ncbi:hypothetical protein ACFQXB_10365 [Plastorhodobacter daqingensis]|uniref:Uncharacterized protein n=1 Tax=Plastorhodobacter daqingensis TaxID=1387281 RepID=A0ABW2UMS0_9RHOB
MRASLRRVLIALLALSLAGPAAADVLRRLHLAEAAAPERLRLRVQGAALSSGQLPPFALPRMRAEMVRQGYYFTGGPPALVARELVLAPLLAWDGNINGGVLQDRFVFDGLVFEAAPEARAKPGLVGGAQASGMARLAWDTGRLIDLRGGLDLGWSPEHRISRADARLGVCSQNHLTGWTFLDLCASGARYWRDLTEGTATEISVEAVQIVTNAGSAHQFGARLIRASGGAGGQNRLALSAESVWSRLATRGTVTLGAPSTDRTVLRYRLEGGITWLALGRAFSLDLSRQVLDGGAFLGIPRRDEVHALALSSQLRPGATLRIGILDSSSTAGIANYSQVTLDLRLTRWR